MKIQLKRSNVLESGAAKQPTTAQMEYGELAVNYNSDDPAIFIKDSSNNIIRISGVGNIADDGLTNVPDGTVPPTNAEPGNLWFNSEDGRLYIYYDDGDSEQWVDASPDSWDPSAMPDLSDPDPQPGSLDDRYVNKVGDNMTGNLTIASDKVQLNTDGSAVFAGGELRIFGTGALQNSRDDNSGYLQTNYVTAFRNDGAQVWRGGPAFNNWTSEIFTDGSAKFAGRVRFKRPTDGAAAFEIGYNTELFSGIAGENEKCGLYNPSGGGVSMYAALGNVPGNSTHFGIYNTDTDKVVSKLMYDGSAEFAGRVDAGGNDYDGIVFAAKNNSSFQTLNLVNYGDGLLIKGSNQGSVTFELNSDGSAEFAGDVDVNSNSLRQEGARVVSNGVIQVRKDANGLNRCIEVYKGGNLLSNITANINNDGSAKFAGSITSDGSIYSGYANYPNSGCKIGADGSAEFAGNVDVGSYGVSAGTKIYPTGRLFIQRSSSNPVTDNVIKITRDTVSVATINGDGSAKFLGQITGENNLILENRNAGTDTASAPKQMIYIATSNSDQSSVPSIRIGVYRDSNVNTSFFNFAQASSLQFTKGYGGTEDVGASIIKFNDDGSAEFKGNVSCNNSNKFIVGTPSKPNVGGLFYSQAEDAVSLEVGSTTGNVRLGNAVTSKYVTVNHQANIISNGSATFSGNVVSQGTNTQATLGSYGGVTADRAPGSNAIVFAGGTSDQASTDKSIKLFADGSATFAGTVTANGTILTRAGGVTLDVGDRLEKVDAALQTLKTAAASATTIASLKSAIATALADI